MLTRRIVSKRSIARVALALAAVLGSPTVFALSLGAEQVTSALGQPLRMAVPLLGATSESLDTRCFRVVPPLRPDGLSVVTQARIELQTSTTPPLLIVRSNRSIDEPIVRISIEVGCDALIRRDYTLFLDPPSVQQTEPRFTGAPFAQTPVAAAEQVPSSTLPMPRLAPRESPATAARVTSGRDPAESIARRKSTRKDRPAVATEGTPREKSAVAAAPTRSTLQDQLQVQPTAADRSSNAGVEDAALAALAVPRLRVSSDLVLLEPSNQPGAAVKDELQAAIAKDRRARLLAAPIEQDLAPRLEADLVVAQRRLAELQLQLTAAGIVVKSDAEAAGTKTPGSMAPLPAAGNTRSWVSWMWIPGLLLVAGLIGFLLRQRRAQRPVQFAMDESAHSTYVQDDETTVVLPTPRKPSARVNETDDPSVQHATAVADVAPAVTSPVAAPTSVSTPIITARAEREASDRLNNPLFQLRDTESHVDVTELSQVTEEAQVYADLGRNDQAIELLRDHIDAQSGERSSPAPWLMIFELYRRTNNRAGYDELAPLFRRHFNGRVPDWDNYGHELALDDGLEAFPHLVSRIARDWGTADARKFLEELLYDNRGGSRLGFSLAAYRDILLLLQVHEGLGAAPDLPVEDWESRGADDGDGTPKWDLSLETIEPPKTGELESFLNRPPSDKL